MGTPARTAKRKDTRPGHATTPGPVKSSSAATPPERRSPDQARPSAPDSPSSSSDTLSEIVAEIVVRTDGMGGAIPPKPMRAGGDGASDFVPEYVCDPCPYKYSPLV
jgi:hypothetical protein